MRRVRTGVFCVVRAASAGRFTNRDGSQPRTKSAGHAGASAAGAHPDRWRPPPTRASVARLPANVRKWKTNSEFRLNTLRSVSRFPLQIGRPSTSRAAVRLASRPSDRHRGVVQPNDHCDPVHRDVQPVAVRRIEDPLIPFADRSDPPALFVERAPTPSPVPRSGRRPRTMASRSTALSWPPGSTSRTPSRRTRGCATPCRDPGRSGTRGGYRNSRFRRNTYSAVMARSTSIRAARRAGKTAASTPTTAASTTKITSCTTGNAQHADALVRRWPAAG